MVMGSEKGQHSLGLPRRLIPTQAGNPYTSPVWERIRAACPDFGTVSKYEVSQGLLDRVRQLFPA